MNVNGFLGAAELALGGDDHRDGGKHDDSAEDQESGLVGGSSAITALTFDALDSER
jgi:hypothetical protein